MLDSTPVPMQQTPPRQITPRTRRLPAEHLDRAELLSYAATSAADSASPWNASSLQPTLPLKLADLSLQSTAQLVRLSGMRQLTAAEADGEWPDGIQQTGPFVVKNLYGREPFGRILAQPASTIAPTGSILQPTIKKRPTFLSFLRVGLGLLVGLALLLLVSRFIDLGATLTILRQNLATPRGIGLALLAGLAFLLAFSVRSLRWRLFLQTVGNVSFARTLQLFLLGTFLNFLLPIRGGEVAKSLALKRLSGIPVSQSLPTIAMDKALDLLPAPFIMALVPLLGISLDLRLWLILALVGSLLFGLLGFGLFAAWKRPLALALLQRLSCLLPGSLGVRAVNFATGFIDALLAAASRPRLFLPAILLTILAVLLEGLFAMLAFWTIGYPLSFGAAIFGYTLYNMFYVLPTPPGQVGSNEAVGLLVFTGLLHLPANKVTAMFIFSHPWAALLMTVSGLLCLSALGLTITTAMHAQD